MEKSTKGLPPFARQAFVTSAICINIVGTGCSIGFPAVLVMQLSRPDAIIPLDHESSSWIASILTFPLLLGNLIMPGIMNKFGRRTAAVAVTLPFLLGWLITAGAESFAMLIVGRLLHGLGFGMNMSIRSITIGEYTSPKYRGGFLIFVSLAQATGVLVVHLLGACLFWQETALICAAFHFIALLMTLHIPESPSYLAAKGKLDKCRNAFYWLRGDTEEKELEEMVNAHTKSAAAQSRKSFNDYINIFKKKEFYLPVIIMSHLFAMMQFAGGPTMSVYITLIINLTLGPTADAAFWMVFLDAQRIVFNIITVFVINKIKRRTMLFLTGALCVGSHLAIAGYVFAKNRGMLAYDAMWIPILFINLQVCSLGLGVIPLPNVIAGEVFPYEYRAIGSSISLLAIAFFSFIAVKTFPVLSKNIGIEGVYSIYALLLIYFLTVEWFVLPETKGKTLQQIEDGFRGHRDNKDVERPLTSEEEKRQQVQMHLNRKQSVISQLSSSIVL